MGSLLSTAREPTPLEHKKNVESASNSDPLFEDDVTAQPAEWSHEPMCRTFQRFIGLLPDSSGEVLKQQQQYSWFERRLSSFMASGNERVDAVIVIQQSYRRYLRLHKWHEIGDHFLRLARIKLTFLRAQQEEKISAANFRSLLTNGFSANKVTISGALKAIQIRLVLNVEAGDCYLTWTPSRKKKPRVNLYDIAKVIAVEKEGNEEAPKLAKKVSHRRGLIIVCKRYHRGRIVLEAASKPERNLLLSGFQRLLFELNSEGPTFDDDGAMRNQFSRRQSVLDFFDSAPTSSAATETEILASSSTPITPNKRAMSTFLIRSTSDTKSIEHFYETRFDKSTNKLSTTPESSRRASSSKVLEVRN